MRSDPLCSLPNRAHSNMSRVPCRDTAGQERFNTLHPSYYYKAHACIMVFDVTRKARTAGAPPCQRKRPSKKHGMSD